MKPGPRLQFDVRHPRIEGTTKMAGFAYCHRVGGLPQALGSRFAFAVMMVAGFLSLVSSRENSLGQTSAPLTLDPKKAITQYDHEVWSLDEGLPQSAVQALAQTPNGYLWIGLEEGLVRFDGVQFRLFHKGNTEEFKYNNVFALLTDRDGSLWIGTNGGGLIHFKNGRFIAYTTQQGLANDVVKAIHQDHAGNLWIGTNDGLNRFQDGQFTLYTTTEGLSPNVVTAIYEDRAGDLWIGTDGGGLNRFKDGKFTVYTTHAGLANDVVTAILEDRNGCLWIGTYGGLSRWQDGKFFVYTTKDGLANDFVGAIVEDRAGSLWIGTYGGGLNRWREGKFSTFSTKDGLSNDFIKAIYEDREGSLWIGTYGGGLNRLHEGKFTNYSTQEGLSNNMVWSIYESNNGGLWLGTDRGLNRFKEGKFTVYTTKEDVASNVVVSLYEDRAGNLWIGTAGGGLYCRRNGKITRYTIKDGLSNNFVRSIYEDSKGALWIGTDRGLNHFQAGKFTTYTTQDGLANDELTYLYEDRAGNLWIGSRNGGLNRFHDGKFTIYTTKDGLSSDLIRTIHQDAEGALWIGTSGGLNRFKDGRFTRYTIKEGLFDDVVFQILEDGQGNFWMSCNKGIYRVSKQQLNDFAEGKIKALTCVAYGKADGMKSNECNGGSQFAGWKTRDGKLWFPTTKGAVMIDPNNLKSNPLPPPVVIEQVIVNSNPINLNIERELRLSPESKNFEFHYAGLSFVAPKKVQFKYKLEGFDKGWVEAGARRVAYYTNIPPGDYTFRAIACNNDGVWNEAGAVLAFYLKPHFYQTKLFYVLCILALVVSGASAYRFRERQIRDREAREALRRANAALEIRVQERTAELEESQNFLNSVIDNLPAMLFVKDAAELRFVRFNRGGEEMIGLTQQEMLGKNDYDFFPKEQADFFTSKDRVVLNGGQRIDISEEPIQTPRGTRWLYTRKAPVLGAAGQPKYLLGISEDITERKQAEAEIRRLNEELEQRVIARTAQLQVTNTALQREIAERKRAQEQLQYRVELEELITTISTNFINLPTAQIDNAINQALQALGEFTGVDRSYVMQIYGDGKKMDNTHEWCAEGIASQIRFLQGLELDQFPWAKTKIANREILNIPRVNELPPEASAEKAGFQAQGLQSLINIPMIAGQSHLGMIGFDSVREERVWTEDIITSLKIVGEIFANALERKRAEKALQESEERFHQLAENINEVLWMESVDANRLIYVSPVYEKVWGRNRESLLKQPSTFIDYVHPEDRESFKAHLGKQRRGQISETEYRIIRPDGSVRWIWDRGFPIRNGDGHVYRSAGISEDITERKLAEAALRRRTEQIIRHQAALLELAKIDYTDLVAAQKRITEVDAKTLNVERVSIWVFNQDRSEIICEDLYKLSQGVHENGLRLQAQDYPDYFQVLRDSHLILANDARRDPRTCEFTEGYLEPSGITSMMDVAIWHQGKVAGIVCHEHTGPLREWTLEEQDFAASIADMIALSLEASERKRLEKQLRQYTEGLEKLVDERAKQIQELERQRAESEKLAATGRMAARIAHEINNPLAGIKNSFLLIKDAIPSTYQHYEYVGRIEREIDRIARIIRQMFDLYRQEQDQVRRFRADNAIHDVIALLQPSFREHGLTCEVDADKATVTVTLPEDALRQILFNIIQNAIEASPEGGVVKVAAAVTDNGMNISIADQGPGIPEEVRPRIFEPFFTTKSKLTTGGLGLGLSISKSLVESMRGTLAFETRNGAGTVVRITLPLNN